MKELKKINIIGCAGSGKTYTSKKISEILKVNAIELDELFWDKTDYYYNRKSNPEDREQELLKIIGSDSWILEGIYYDWLSESFQKADQIILLKTNIILSTFRIIVRFAKEKTGIVKPKKKETFMGLIQVIIRNIVYYRVSIPEINRLLSPYGEKFRVFKSGDEVLEHILSTTQYNSDNYIYKIKRKPITEKLISIKVLTNYLRLPK